MKRRKETGWGSQDAKNDMMVSSLGFFLTHMSQTGCWRKQQPRNINGYRPNKQTQTPQLKPAISSQRTKKGDV